MVSWSRTTIASEPASRLIMNLLGTQAGTNTVMRTDKTAESFRTGTTLSVGPREGDAWAMLGDSAFTQSS